MGIENHKCDSCDSIVDILFPLIILDELPTGGEQMVRRYYCIKCEEEIRVEAEDMEDDEGVEEEDDPESRPPKPPIARGYKCGCRFDRYKEHMEWWVLAKACVEHWKENSTQEKYLCGCVVEFLTSRFYRYIEVCETHE